MPREFGPSPEEMGINLQESGGRKNFDEVDEVEQIDRFQAIRDLFASEGDSASYQDFWDNIYKYPERFKIQGGDQKQVSDTLAEAASGNKLIKEALDFFLAVRKNQVAGGQDSKIEQAIKVQSEYLNRIIDEQGQAFSEPETRQLNIERLKNLFRWSLDTFMKGGEKIGRVPNISPEKVAPMTEDLEAILKHVNSFR